MIRKLTHNTVAAAAFAALLLVGACASSNDNLGDNTDPSDTVQEVTQSGSVAPAPGPALVDSDGNVYSSSAAPGHGNPSTAGTNTNVTEVPAEPTTTIVETTTIEEPVITTPTTTVTETMETTTTTTVPMTSAAPEPQEEVTPTRTRMRKD
jgi:hypothetical protein